MKLIRYSMLGLFILSLVFVAGNSISAPIFSIPLALSQVELLKRHPQSPGPGGPITGYSTLAAFQWVAGSTVMSSELKTSQGGYLAEISDLLIDPANGRVSNVVITRIRGIGAKHIVIPFSTVSKTGDNLFIYNAPEDVYPVSGRDPYWSEGLYVYSKQQEPMGSYKTSELVGASARTSEGEEVGQIVNLGINCTDGRGYLIVSHSMGTEEKMFVVPLISLVKKDGNTFRLKNAKADIEAAPTFTWSDMNNLQ
jgi:sporulation protein YlmC with PRC-barrel domain